MRLHEDSELFRQAVQVTAQRMQIPEIYVEKDYWIVCALRIIFNHDVGCVTIFKGGTSLLKCYGLIKRFSEDIDLVVLKDKSETNSQLKKKIRMIGSIVNDVLPEVDIPGVTHKMGMIRKTAHSYVPEFSGNFGQVRDKIIARLLG